MNGPSHYRAAEDAVAQRQGDVIEWIKTPTAEVELAVRLAQAHATLANTAAAALGAMAADGHAIGPQDITAWMQAVSADPHWGEPDPLADVEVGDPDPYPDDLDNCCGATGPGLWVCGRPAEHPGQHIAGSGPKPHVKAVWPRLRPGGSQ
jgi:hypothetical protein